MEGFQSHVSHVSAQMIAYVGCMAAFAWGQRYPPAFAWGQTHPPGDFINNGSSNSSPAFFHLLFDHHAAEEGADER